MFTDLAQSMMMSPEIPNETVQTLVIMILVPLFWILRGVAIIGISLPFLRLLVLEPHFNTILGHIIFALFWGILNSMILLSDISEYWKWIWVDVVGFSIAISFLFIVQSKILKNYYKIKYSTKKLTRRIKSES